MPIKQMIAGGIKQHLENHIWRYVLLIIAVVALFFHKELIRWRINWQHDYICGIPEVKWNCSPPNSPDGGKQTNVESK